MRHIAVPDREAAEVDKAKGGEEELEGVSWGDTPDGVSDTTEQPWVQGKGKRRGKVRKRNKEEENETASAGFEGTPKKIVGMQRMEVPKDLEAVSSQQLSSVESVAAEEVMGSVSPSSSMIPDTGLEEEVLQSARQAGQCTQKALRSWEEEDERSGKAETELFSGARSPRFQGGSNKAPLCQD
ncbi:UNVERIFIED_CONTAM: hypothetical protein FKN15_017723 [Acipenser sinensis]